jgi:hypothetical protein
MCARKQVRKVPFVARSEIIFDQNAPIQTNAARMHFKADYRGRTDGWRLSQTCTSGDPSYLSYFAGTAIAPYRPYRFFYQAEVMPVFQQFTIRDATTGEEILDLREWHLDIVPLQLRKNITSFAGLGGACM